MALLQGSNQLNGLNIQSGTSLDYNIGSYNFSAVGSYEIKAIISVVGEFNHQNDTTTGVYAISPLQDGSIEIDLPGTFVSNSRSAFTYGKTCQ